MKNDARNARLRMAAWFVASTGIVLLALAAVLFVLLTRERSSELTRDLERATNETIKAAAVIASQQQNATLVAARAVAELNTPYMPLYLFDGDLRYIGPTPPPPAIFNVARRALSEDVVRMHFEQNAQTWRAVAQEFAVREQPYVIVAVTDESELDRQYLRLIELFAVAAFIGVLLLGVSSYYFAGRAVAPIQANADATRRFMTDAAHELRTPIATVRAHAELALQRGDADPEARATLRTIVDETARLSGLVGDLLTLARADTGERVIAREVFYLDDVVSDTTAAASGIARAKDVHLAQGRYEQARIAGDAQLVHQLVMILIDNALKYTPTEGSVVVDVFAEGEHAVVAVTDTGMGIEKDALPHIFERFYRAEAARGATQGTGLGLSIAHWIADLHGAEIDVASSVQEGTRFQVRFPRAP